MEFQVAVVRNPLGSFRKIAEKGNRIVIDHEGNSVGYIETKKTKDRIPLRIDSGVYVFDILADLDKSLQSNSHFNQSVCHAVASDSRNNLGGGQATAASSGFMRPGAF